MWCWWHNRSVFLKSNWLIVKICKRSSPEPGVIMHVCNPNNWEAEAEGLQTQGQH